MFLALFFHFSGGKNRIEIHSLICCGPFSFLNLIVSGSTSTAKEQTLPFSEAGDHLVNIGKVSFTSLCHVIYNQIAFVTDFRVFLIYYHR